MLRVLCRFCCLISLLVLIDTTCVPYARAAENTAASQPILTIDDAVKIALAQNRSLQAAALDITKANDTVASARTGLLPVVSVKANAGVLLDPLNVRIPAGSLGTVDHAPFPTNNALVYSAHGAIGSVNASIAQPLTQLPVIRLNIALQKFGVQVAQEQQRAHKLTLIAGVKQTYYQILQTQDSIVTGEESLKSDQELVRTVTDFVTHETALQADLLDAQTQFAQQELVLTQLHDTLANAKEQMNVLLGRDIAAPFDVIEPTETQENYGDLDALRRRALAQRPELREADLHVRQAEIGKSIAQEPNLPAISLAMSYDQLPANINGLPNHVWTLGFLLDWSPIDWGKRKAQLDLQTQQYEQAKINLTDQQSQTILDVDTKMRQFSEARAQLTVAQAGQRAAQERLREMMNQYQARAILLKDVLQQQAAMATANDRVQQSLLQVFAAQIALKTAIGDDE